MNGNYLSKKLWKRHAQLMEINKPKFSNFEKIFERPYHVQVDLTNKCNLNCVYCYNKKNSLGKKDLSDKKYKLLIKKIIKELNPVYVSFSGGEPLLKANLFFELARELKKKNIKVHLNTNSLLLTEKIAKELNKIRVDKVNINIDSFNSQDKLRGGKKLIEKTLKSIDTLKQNFPKEKISIACVITNLNYKDILEIAKYVKKQGFMEIHLLDMIPCEPCAKKLFLTKEQWKEFYKTYKKIKRMGIKINPNHALLFLKEFEKYVKIPFCMAGRLKMVISANGKIIPCNYFRTKKFVCGNALKGNLLEKWQNSPILKTFRYFLPKEEKCQKCKLINLCTGGCRAMSFFIEGDLFKADPYCLKYNLKDD